jgi:aspartate ammonia-lyase
MANDQAHRPCLRAGNLELNPFLPLVADCLLESLDLLRRSCDLLADRCIAGLTANADRCAALVQSATATVTALVGEIGYAAAQDVARAATDSGRPIRDIILERGLLSAEAFDALITPEAVTRLGTPKPGPAGDTA